MILLEKLDDRFSQHGNNRIERHAPLVNRNRHRYDQPFRKEGSSKEQLSSTRIELKLLITWAAANQIGDLRPPTLCLPWRCERCPCTRLVRLRENGSAAGASALRRLQCQPDPGSCYPRLGPRRLALRSLPRCHRMPERRCNHARKGASHQRGDQAPRGPCELHACGLQPVFAL